MASFPFRLVLPSPHITLLPGSIINRDALLDSVDILCRESQCFTIEAMGLGAFCLEKPLLYLRWKDRRQLRNFNQFASECLSCLFADEHQSVDPAIWVPKTTLCWKDVSYENIGSVITELRRIDFCHRMNVSELLVLSYDEDGETEIYRFRFTASH